MNPTDLTSRLALDSRGFESLKQTARTDPNGAAKEVVNCRCTVGTFLVRRRNALAMGPNAFAQPIPGFWQQPTREPFVADSPIV